MSFVFHIVPKQMIGTELIPLGELASVHPGVYEVEVKKYDDHPKRKGLPKQNVKKLNCPREAVLHFAPIHPHLMLKGLQVHFPDGKRPVIFYKIPIEHIRGLPAVVFDMNRMGAYNFEEEEPEEMFELVTPETYRMLTELPAEALAFYKEWKDRGERGAPAFGRVPHVMVKGRVSIVDCETVNWLDPIE